MIVNVELRPALELTSPGPTLLSPSFFLSVSLVKAR